ncbi:MAG TPA: ABC transporter permease [Solirubrobacterales bacterium]|jgi:spermidine/putrescine transport system permease protein|nr:ABC transporter permease [Solirubrobacterales bacterium]HMU26435.1 ABC transporter permease [Solirubrobacterales bacterium]HMW44584.1 ABC transporter permease [Solirubrobacterales bacterium]HMX70764.1 ABC transporter permease [Solirubrobacterales bacterium]HMY25662.1 ABC transporter permease [Solirubrobacterales bacterium]
MTIRRRLIPYWLLAPGLIWLVLFFVIPMYYMGELSLKTGSLETGYQLTWAFENYTDSISEYSTQFIRAFWYAGVATFFCLLIGYPLAYAIAFKAGRWKNLMLFAVVAPFFTTYLIRTIAWKTILDDSSPVVSFLKTIHLVPQDGRVLATSAAVIAGLTYNFLPFMVLPLFTALERLDQRLLEAGKDLYASATQTFWRITLPLTMPGIIAGILLTFIPAAGDYVNATFLGGTNQAMIGNVIQSKYLVVNDYPDAAALSFTLMAIILVALLFYIKFAGSEALMGEEEETR